MVISFSGIRFLLVSTDVNFLRNIKNKLKNTYSAEVFFCSNVKDAKLILEVETVHIAIFCLEDKDLVLEFTLFFQEITSQQGLLYFLQKKNHFIDKNFLKNIPQFSLENINFLQEPVDWEEILAKLHLKIIERNTSLQTLNTETKQIQYYLLFQSQKMKENLEFLPRIANTDYSVLITGESGTGKEMVARAIHSISNRRNKSFVAVNCGAIPENLVESELFGHERGSFTGASATKKGKFEIAHKGTLLLDEIGDMPLHLQVKLLRILEEGQVYRVGSEKSISVDVRVLASTNVSLQQKIQEKLFREDLFYRLNILQIKIPPLRERKEDIGLLAWHFLQKVLSELDYPAPYPYLSDEAVAEIQQKTWKGNVRELKNFMTSLAVLLPPSVRRIESDYLKKALQKFSNVSEYQVHLPENSFITSLDKTLEEIKDLYIEEIIALCKNNKTKAAKSLGISVRSLRQKAAKKNI